MKTTLNLDRIVRHPDRLHYAVGGNRVWIGMVTRPYRARWWQFWRHPRIALSVNLFSAPLTERLLASWVRRLERPGTSSLRSHPRVEFTQPAIREALLREFRQCLDGHRGMQEAAEHARNNPDEVSVFLSGRAVSEDEVEERRFLVNGEPRSLTAFATSETRDDAGEPDEPVSS